MCGQGDSLGIVQKLNSDHTNKCYLNDPECLLENETHKLLWDFDIQTDHFVSIKRSDIVIISKKVLVEWWLYSPGWPQSEIERRLKKYKYLDLAREMKKLWNMNVTVTAIIIGALSIVTKGWVEGLEFLEIRRRVETIQTPALLRLTRILRRSWRLEATCCHSNSWEKL